MESELSSNSFNDAGKLISLSPVMKSAPSSIFSISELEPKLIDSRLRHQLKENGPKDTTSLGTSNDFKSLGANNIIFLSPV